MSHACFNRKKISISHIMQPPIQISIFFFFLLHSSWQTFQGVGVFTISHRSFASFPFLLNETEIKFEFNLIFIRILLKVNLNSFDQTKLNLFKCVQCLMQIKFKFIQHPIKIFRSKSYEKHFKFYWKLIIHLLGIQA